MSAPQPHRAEPGSDLVRRIHQGEILFIVLVLLSGVGVAVTNFSPERGFHYWLLMVPLFGGVATFLAWARARARADSTGTALRTQALHWVGLLGALQLVFLLKTAGQLNFDALGLVALILLALTTFLAGVHGDWRLCPVGILLGTIAAVGAFVQQFVWTAVIPAVALLVVGFVIWRRRSGSAPSEPYGGAEGV